MAHQGLLVDLGLILAVAAAITLLFRRFHLPVVLGYIVAGVLIGLHALPFHLISNEASIHTLSELGVVFLLFTLGLEFSLRKLKAVGPSAILGGVLEIGGMMLVGNLLGRALGWSSMDSLFLGGMLAISSTTIIVKVFTELGIRKKPVADMVFGLLIVEDLAAIVLLAVFSGLTHGAAVDGGQTAFTVGRLVIFLIVSLVLGLLAIPRFIGWVAHFKSDELLLVTVLGLCLGFSALVMGMGYSVALGAFLMGAMLGESRVIGRIESLMMPLRDLFCAVFFVSVGLLIEPKALVENWSSILIIAGVLVAGKISFCSFGAFLTGRDFADSLRVGLSMAQIGEFSFVMAALGRSQDLTMSSLYPIAVCVSALTTFTTPWLIRGSTPMAKGMLKTLPGTFVKYLDLYHRWTINFGERSRNSAIQKILKRIFGQLTVFAALISGSFLTALFLARVSTIMLPIPPRWWPWIDSGLWLTALIVAMPVILAGFRKVKALGMIFAELGISESMAGKRYLEIRAILSNVFLLVGTGLLTLYVGLLSSAILPSAGLLILIVLAATGFAYLLRGSLNKIYFQGKAALVEIIDSPHIEEADGLIPQEKVDGTGSHPRSPVQRLLQEAQILRVDVEGDSGCAGRLIRETRLRELTGTSILAIEKPSGLVVNPGPDEELQAGDKALLLGTPAQLAEAKPRFRGK